MSNTVAITTSTTPGLRSSPPIFEIRGRGSEDSSAHAVELNKMSWVKTIALSTLAFTKPSSMVMSLV